MTGSPVVVGLDLGTSSAKAVALSLAGPRVLARARFSYPTHRPHDGASEQDPHDWWRAVTGVLRELGAHVPPERWAAIGLSAMLPTLVPLGADARPAGPAITWEDARAEQAAALLRDRFGATEVYRRTGQWLDGRYLVPMMSALAERDPAVAARTTTVAGAKDYLVWQLTGELCTDPSTAAGYGCFLLDDQAWEPDWSGDRRLPEVRPANTVLALHPVAAGELGCRPGLPVVLGAADSVLGARAAGAARPGDVAYLTGTSTAILGIRASTETDADHRYLVTPTAGDGWAAEADLLATGSALSWLAQLCGVADGPAALVEEAYRLRPPTASSWPAFLPYLAPGEQGALWDPRLRGALVGLQLGHGRAEIARALLTGIVLESARCVRLVAAGAADGPVWAAGPAMCRPFALDLADASGRPVHFDPDESAHSALGAGLLAADALGLQPADALGQQRGDAARSGLRAEPDPARTRRWGELFERHELLRESVGHIGDGGDQQ
jgi:sugar (pentulose or hexulose) kinase